MLRSSENEPFILHRVEGRQRKKHILCPTRKLPASAAPPEAPHAADPRPPRLRLADNLAASDGVVFLTGTQALIRLALMQAARDAAAGVQSRGFISGYRGSPLGMVDQQAWKARSCSTPRACKFLPAINEELGATAVLGTQRVESDPERTADGVFAMWYGKGPGVDRAGDALKHGNAYGSSPHGGVLVVAGDDHGCVSSSMPHQSDVAMQSWHMPWSRRRASPSTSSSALRLGAVALLGQLGRLHRALGEWSRAARPSTST
jgi:indolepyruvate ferredoxin oxidoreductase